MPEVTQLGMKSTHTWKQNSSSFYYCTLHKCAAVSQQVKCIRNSEKCKIPKAEFPEKASFTPQRVRTLKWVNAPQTEKSSTQPSSPRAWASGPRTVARGRQETSWTPDGQPWSNCAQPCGRGAFVHATELCTEPSCVPLT